MSDSGDCSSVTEALPEYLAGRVSVEEDARIRDHLDTCAECRTRANAVSLLQQTPVPDPDPERWGDFVGGVVRATDPGRRRPGRRSWLVAAAAVVVIAVGVATWRLAGGGPDDAIREANPELAAIARQIAVLPGEEAAAWTVGVEPEPWMPVGFDLEGLSETELERLLEEVERS